MVVFPAVILPLLTAVIANVSGLEALGFAAAGVAGDYLNGLILTGPIYLLVSGVFYFLILNLRGLLARGAYLVAMFGVFFYVTFG